MTEGDLVVEHFTARGTHHGKLMGVPGHTCRAGGEAAIGRFTAGP